MRECLFNVFFSFWSRLRCQPFPVRDLFLRTSLSLLSASERTGLFERDVYFPLCYQTLFRLPFFLFKLNVLKLRFFLEILKLSRAFRFSRPSGLVRVAPTIREERHDKNKRANVRNVPVSLSVHFLPFLGYSLVQVSVRIDPPGGRTVR